VTSSGRASELLAVLGSSSREREVDTNRSILALAATLVVALAAATGAAAQTTAS
jgi:hypothetical protein